MGRILDQLGIYGYRLNDETRILAGLLTGDPQLFVGRHGGAKTMLAEEVATALYWDSHVEKGLPLPFVAYDTSKMSFEDVVGFPHPQKLNEGVMDFVPGPTTFHGKEFIFADEINRADADMQSKWLELIRSKRIMGYPTDIKFCWAAMNPKGYEGTQDLDEALVGRFANFVYVPDVLDLSDGLRAKVAARVGRDDSPAIRFWQGHDDHAALAEKLADLPGVIPDYRTIGQAIHALMKKAAHQYMILSQDYGDREYDRIAHWVSRFANMLKSQSQVKSGGDDQADNETHEILLDGRRLGMIRRQILAMRAMHIVRANLFHEKLPHLRVAAEIAVKGSIPTGLNEEGGTDSTAIGIIDKAFKNLVGEFDHDKNDRMADLIYELGTSPDITRRVQILLTEPVEEMTKNTEWTRICSEPDGLELSVLSFLAQMIESKNSGTIPRNVLSQLSSKIDDRVLRPSILPLQQQHMEHADRLTNMVERWKTEEEIPQRLLSVAMVNEFIHETNESTTMKNIAEERVKILEDQIRDKCLHLKDMMTNGVGAYA